MQSFTGREYLKIDIANSFGMDKENWIDRLLWTEANLNHLEDRIDEASDKFLYAKAVNAYRQIDKGNPVGHMMLLDATASGIQIMAALSGCHKTAEVSNLLDPHNRRDIYQDVQLTMNKRLDQHNQVTRPQVKYPVMTHYYNKQSQKDDFNELQEQIFYDIMEDLLPGAEDVKNLINASWDSNGYYHRWTLPDGHIAKVKVFAPYTTRIEVDELDHTTYTYMWKNNEPVKRGISLAPNIIHSIDGYIARQMVKRAHSQGFQLVHIHDAFGFHPNYGNHVRLMYRQILSEIAQSNLLQDILSEIEGQTIHLKKDSHNLFKYIANSEYALS